MSTDTTNPRMGRINLPVPMELKSLAVKAAHESGMNLETWVAKALQRQAKETLMNNAWRGMIDRIRLDIEAAGASRVSIGQLVAAGLGDEDSPYSSVSQFADEIQMQMMKLGIIVSSTWTGDGVRSYIDVRKV